MAKQLQCDCGFTATGPDTTVEQLQNIAVQHIKDTHPDMLQQYGEGQVRAMSGNFIRDV
jgi:predicted small metal-binding protein